MAYENQIASSLALAVNADNPAMAQANAVIALAYVARSIDGHLAELIRDIDESRCGHGTPTLFSPCVDCAKVEGR